jgi:hypothetical protein
MTNQIPPKAKGWRLAYNTRAAGADQIRYTTLDPKYPYFVEGEDEVNITIENLTRQMETDAKLRKEGVVHGGSSWFVKRAKQEKKPWMLEVCGKQVEGGRVEFFRTEQEAIAFARKWMEAHPSTPAQAIHPATKTRKTTKKTAAAKPKTSTKVLKVNAGFREVSHFGVAHHMNADNSIAYFRFDTYYPALKENTMLTKSKIGSGKVRFKDLQQPLACMYQGKVYLIAPYDPDDAPALPKSMTKPKTRLPPVSKSMTKPKTRLPPVSKSGTMGDDSVVIGGHSIVRIGETVMTKRGAGELRGIDTTTYSIPSHKYELVYVTATELTQKKPKTKKPAARKPAPAPNLPPALTAPPELTADILGTGPMGLTPAPATKPKRKPKKTAAKPAKKPKTTKKPAPKLTAAQREHLAIQGFVMVKRGGKYVKITG